jgi:hypothetical protein
MALDTIRRGVVLTLAQTNDHIRDAEWIMRNGDDLEKVLAAGELDFLHRQQVMLVNRLVEIDRRLAAHQTLFSWVRQEWFSLKLHFEDWITHG